ncbi:NAD(P)H-dependent oxidoreductase [Natribacillus halophilus]|uniref:NAD(P)H dehydrogenase (Quinone) n=1 Tax=Natribacillus halophilus TaxID=549003 RepID=A0A1G8LIX7_9BACI|nr:NAD(P)H-dependent oxidoreductase [Natribacillus halophilus]SDI55662.1 NAD(P)H dehydrogenase (quinone) [Natribacillus halophilus]
MHLIIYMHPSEDSFNRALLDEYRAAWEARGEEVVVRDLYRLAFDPLLSWTEYEQSQHYHYQEDIIAEHRYIERAAGVTFIFPVWWGSLPAIGKGYLDRVLSFGFAFELDGETPIPKMAEKPLGMIYTTGAPQEVWERSGQKEWMENLFKKAISDFCGFRQVRPLHLGYVVLADEDERETMFAQVRQYPEYFQ